MKNVSVFSDNDGVNAGFMAGFKVKFKREFDQTPVGLAWSLIGKDPSFFADLPLMPNVDVYWTAIKDYAPVILTGCTSAKFAQGEAGKRSWLEKHRNIFGSHTRMIVCLTKDKPKYMNNPGDILIDDHQKNIDAWIAAGGRGILFVNANQASNDFKKLVEQITNDQKDSDDE